MSLACAAQRSGVIPSRPGWLTSPAAALISVLTPAASPCAAASESAVAPAYEHANALNATHANHRPRAQTPPLRSPPRTVDLVVMSYAVGLNRHGSGADAEAVHLDSEVLTKRQHEVRDRRFLRELHMQAAAPSE